MNKNNGLLTLVGFILAGLGFFALVLSVVGAKLSFLLWIDAWGAGVGFVIRLLMILVGIIIIYLAQTDFEGKNPN
jgi:hypothetical protein